MDDSLAVEVGERVRFYRAAVRKTKTVVAGLTGITPDYLYQIERGQKVPALSVLVQLADVLGVEPGCLIRGRSPNQCQRSDEGAAAAICRALTGRGVPQTVPSLTQVRREVGGAWHTWQTSPHRYSSLTAGLSNLIINIEAVVESAGTTDLRAARACAADLYGLVRTFTKRIGRVDLSLLAADRGVRAAQAAEDPIRLAGAHWNMAQVLLAGDEVEAAEDVAMGALEKLRSPVEQDRLDAMALSGSLLLIAAVAAARRRDEWTARDRLQQAVPLAERTGERNTCWTAFGPINVAMHAVTVEVETGEAVEGLRLAERVEYVRSPSIERRVAFLIDQARGHQQRRDYASTLLLLQTAENEAPEDMRHRPAARNLLRAVIENGRRSVSQQAVQIAERLGVPA